MRQLIWPKVTKLWAIVTFQFTLDLDNFTENLAVWKIQIWSVCGKLEASAIQRENSDRKIKVGLPEFAHLREIWK